MKMGWTGFESAGKSQLMAVHSVKVLNRNIRWIKKRNKLGLPFVQRTMAFDSPMSPAYIAKCEEWGIRYLHFDSLNQVLPLVECDIFMHEVYKWFPSRGSEPLNPEQREFLSQAAKEGINIYFCTQDFSLVHKGFRFLVWHLHEVIKIAGSERPCRSAPPVKRIWGIVLYWPLDPKQFKGDDTTMAKLTYIPSFYWINREDTQLYDTSHRVRGIGLPPINMIEQEFIYLDRDGEEVKRDSKWVKR